MKKNNRKSINKNNQKQILSVGFYFLLFYMFSTLFSVASAVMLLDLKIINHVEITTLTELFNLTTLVIISFFSSAAIYIYSFKKILLFISKILTILNNIKYNLKSTKIFFKIAFIIILLGTFLISLSIPLKILLLNLGG